MASGGAPPVDSEVCACGSLRPGAWPNTARERAGGGSVLTPRATRAPRIAQVSFDSLPLDDRLRKAVAHVGWSSPSLVQAKALPLAMQGKDVLCRARTGSGKTGAYALPILQKILEFQGFNAGTKMDRKGPSAVVLVPTRELVEQVRQVFAELTHFAPTVSVAAITADTSVAAQKSLLAAR